MQRTVRLVPAWALSYRREWLPRDLLAGVLVAAVVVPQAVAYADIAQLPPEAGLVAAPGALIASALLGTSRTLIVSATTATSALSAAAVGPLANGDVGKYAELSAALALVAAGVLVLAGLLLDVETLDMLAELADALDKEGIELRLAAVRMRPSRCCVGVGSPTGSASRRRSTVPSGD